MMNWFKKKFNRFFDEELDYEEDEKFDDEIELTHESTKEANKRSSFRFPIITDNEIDHVKPENDRKHYRTYEIGYHHQEQNNIVYDVEVSGIRELLEQRRNGKGKAVRKHSVEVKQTIKQKPKLKPKLHTNPNPIKKQKETEIEQNHTVVSQRKFTPTKVPSPVHGFRKPSPINHLLQQKTEQESLKNTEDSISSSAIKETELAAKEVASTVILNDNVKSNLVQIEDIDQVEQTVPSLSIIEVQNTPIETQVDDAIIESQGTKQNNDLLADEHDHQEDEVKKINLEIYEDSLDSSDVEYEGSNNDDTSNEGNNVEESIDQEDEVEKTNLEIYEDSHDVSDVEYEESNDEDTLNDGNNVEEPIDQEVEVEVTNVEIYEESFDTSDIEYEESNDENPVIEENSVEVLIDQEVEFEKTYLDTVEEFEGHNDDPDEEYEDNKDGTEEGSEAIAEELTLKEVIDDSEDPENVVDSNDVVLEKFNDSSKEEIFSPPLNNVEETQNIQHVEAEKNKVSSGSKLPFNVLMLKSDKEKLKMKESIQKADTPNIAPSIVQHSNTNNDFSTEKSVSDEKQLSIDDEIEDQTDNVLEYVKPSFDFLVPPEEETEDLEWMESQADNLVESLSYFQVTAKLESIVQGPAVTQFEITVGHGTKVSKIKNLADDLKLALAAKDIRIQAPIPGKSTIGIEIPNRISRAVRLSEVVRSETFKNSDSPLEAALGLDLTGKPITIDLRKMPHGLIAGATGSGKSVCINSILVSLLYKSDPHELKLMLIDPKVVELAPFNNIPHLVSPVITDVKTATAALKWAVEEMERRYQLFAHVGVRDLSRYNKLAEKNGNKNKLPYILIVIDELADLMMMAPSDVEESIARIAQKARACGIHLIVATQRPSVDVITGLIKSNIPTRIAFAVSSQIDSRTIIDSQGAERLLGRGDMLYLGNGMSAPIRIQGTFVTDDEIEEIIEHVRSQGAPNYLFEHEELLKKTEMIEEYDELFEEVCRFVFEQGTASTSSIQRHYRIGYNRAARLMDLLEKNGFISEQRGSKPREVYIQESDLHSLFD